MLGPLLFSVYVSDISDHILHCEYHLFADDLQIYFSFRPDHMHEAVEKVNEDVSAVT